MSAQDRAIQKLARELAGIKREVTSWRGPQLDYSSIENSGNFTFKDGDGNVTAVVGGQDDGSNTIRHVDGPTPPIPSGLSAHVDGPIVQVSWDGTFEGGVTATHDWSHLEVIVVGPSNEQLTATINDITGASTSVAATSSGEWDVFARSVSRAEKRSLDGDAGTVEVEIVGLSGAIEDAIGSANGKNTVTYSETPPTSEDEGIDGDTWFVNSVDPETSIMLITEQWQFLAGAWVQTELDHQVIATLDAGKIVFGEMDGIRIMAQSIRGQQLSGDAIDGKVVTGGTYRTTGGTGSWSDDGLFIAQPDGTSMVRFPTDGSPLSLTASDVQIDRASVTDLDLSYGSVRSGGQVTLAAGVTAPASPPELTTGWQKVCTLPTPGAVNPEDQLPRDWLGLGYWAEGAGHWVRAVNALGAAGDTFDEIAVYSIDGVFEKAIQAGLNPRHGVTVIGDIAYVLGPDYQQSNIGKQWVHGFDLNTGARVTRWEFTRFWDVKNRLALGTDGTNLVVAGVAPAPTLFVLRFNPATGAQVGSDWSTATGSWRGGQDIEGVHVSGSAFAGFEVTILPKQTARVYTVSGGTLTRKTDTSNASGFAGWNNPNKNGAGYVIQSGYPNVVDGAGGIYKGTPPTSDSTMRICYTWWDGTNETTPSPIASTVVPAMQDFACSMPTRTGLSKRVYVEFAVQPGAWYRTEVSESTTVVSYGDFGGSPKPLPTSNTFPASTPAVLKSSIGGFQVRGDGSGKWGPLTFNADGTMSSSAVPPWVPVTTFAPNFSPGDFGYAPAYRIWPDGKVEWRGVVKRSSASSAPEVVLTIPTAAIPAQYVPMWGARSGATGMRFDVNDPGAPGKIRWNPGSTCSWASLDMISYYTS